MSTISNSVASGLAATSAASSPISPSGSAIGVAADQANAFQALVTSGSAPAEPAPGGAGLFAFTELFSHPSASGPRNAWLARVKFPQLDSGLNEDDN